MGRGYEVHIDPQWPALNPSVGGLRKHTQQLMPTLDTDPKIYLLLRLQIFGRALISDVYQHSKEGLVAHLPQFFPNVYETWMANSNRSLTWTVKYSRLTLMEYVGMLQVNVSAQMSAFEHPSPMLALPAWHSALCALLSACMLEPKVAVVMCHILWGQPEMPLVSIACVGHRWTANGNQRFSDDNDIVNVQ